MLVEPVDGSGAQCLHNWSLIIYLRPLLGNRVYFKDLEVELARDHRGATKAVYDELTVLEDRH